MSLTNLTARALFDPDGAKDLILDQADALNYETRPLAVALGVSYPTLLRVLKRLEITENMRALWLNRRKENKEQGHGEKKTGTR
jgi:hypothetical protein